MSRLSLILRADLFESTCKMRSVDFFIDFFVGMEYILNKGGWINELVL